MMDDRTTNLQKIRPDIPSAAVYPNMGKAEKFQNSTLRPVIKMQNPLLIAAFQNYVTKHKNAFFELSLDKRMAYIENAVQKDVKFRNALKGMVIGQFTLEEYQSYISDSSALNKRMMNMVIKRLKDQIQLFELPVSAV